MTACDTCAMLSDDCELETMRKWNVFQWQKKKLFEESSHVEITNEDDSHHFLRCEGYYSLWIHSTRPNSQLTLLCGNTEAGTWNFGFSTVTMLQLTRQFMAQKPITEMEHPTNSLDFTSNDFWLLQKHKVCLKGTISGHRRHRKGKWRRHRKLFHKRISKSGSIFGLSA